MLFKYPTELQSHFLYNAELLGQVEHVTTLAVQLARLVCEEVATRHQTTLVEKWEAAGRDLNTKLKESRAKKVSETLILY